MNSKNLHMAEEIKILKRLQRSQMVNEEFTAQSNLPPLPLKTHEDIEATEKLLSEHEEEKKNLVMKLHSHGGSTARAVVNSMMNNLLTMQIAQHYSLVGRQGKKAFRALSGIYSCLLGENILMIALILKNWQIPILIWIWYS